MWRKQPKPADQTKIQKRVSALSSHDLVAWADQCLYTTGRNLTAHQRDPMPEYLDEAESGAQVLLAVVQEIRRRQTR